MGDVAIRLATPEDADALVEIHRRARDTYYRGVVPDAELDDPAEYAKMRDAYRAGDDAVAVSGGGELIARLRRLLTAVTNTN